MRWRVKGAGSGGVVKGCGQKKLALGVPHTNIAAFSAPILGVSDAVNVGDG